MVRRGREARTNMNHRLRTCDAVGACMALPDTDHYREALAIGDSRRIRERTCSTGWRVLRDAFLNGYRARRC